MGKKDKLTPKQKKFCDEYLKLGNATQAAKNAGYSEKTAYRTGADNLKVPHILDYINARQEQIASKDIADIEEIMKYLTDVMRGKIKDQFDLDASLSERTKAAQELLKRNVDDRKMNLELAKLEAQFKDNGSDEDAKDNFMDALNSTASEVWTDDE
jgi:phage terminase small subunit|nr:MAG TPA: Terminase small subunit [Caudoviricetes sp.]